MIDDAIDHIERFLGNAAARRWSRSAVTLMAAIPCRSALTVWQMYRLADRMLTLGYKQKQSMGCL